MPADTCLEGGTRHAWTSLGLDVVDADQLKPQPRGTDANVLVHSRRCVWCELEQARLYGERNAWRSLAPRQGQTA